MTPRLNFSPKTALPRYFGPPRLNFQAKMASLGGSDAVPAPHFQARNCIRGPQKWLPAPKRPSLRYFGAPRLNFQAKMAFLWGV